MNRPLIFPLLLLLCSVLSSQNNAPVVVPQIGLNTTVAAMAISPDGQWLATGCRDGSIVVWDTKYGFEVYRLPGFNEKVFSLGFTEDNRLIVNTKSGRKTWQLGNPEPDRPIQLPDTDTERTWFLGWELGDRFVIEGSTDDQRANNLSRTYADRPFLVSPDGLYRFSAHNYGITFEPISNKNERGQQIKFEHELKASAIALSHDGRWLAASKRSGGQVSVWEPRDTNAVHVVETNTFNNRQISLSPDGQYLTTIREGGKLSLWEVKTGQRVERFQVESWVEQAQFSPKGKYLAARTLDKILVMSYPEGKVLYTIEGKSNQFVFSNDGLFAYADFWPRILKWEVGTGRRINSFEGNCAFIDQVHYHPAGRYLFVSAVSQIVKIDPITLEVSQNYLGNDQYLTCFEVSQDGTQIIAGTNEGEIVIWNAENGELLHRMTGHHQKITALALDPQGKYLATCSPDTTIRLWNLADTADMRHFSPNQPASDLVFSNNGQHLYMAFPNGLGDWQMQDQKVYNADLSEDLKATDIRSLEISPDDHQLVLSTKGGKLLWWDIGAGKVLNEIEKDYWLGREIAIHPNGRHVFSIDIDGFLRSLDAPTGVALHQTAIDNRLIANMSIDPGGQYLALSKFGVIEFYSLPGLEKMGSFVLFNPPVHGSWITPEGFYSGPRQTGNNFIFRVGQDFYPMEQFELRFNRPDLVLNALGSNNWGLFDAYQNAYLKRIEKMGFTPNQLKPDLHLPELEITNMQNIAFEQPDSIVTLEVKAQDDQFALDRILVMANDVPVFGKKGIDISYKKAQQVNKSIPVQLLPGENRIQVSVLNAAGAESFRETVFVKYTGETSTPDFYFVGIGVSQFRDTSLNLTYPVKDVKDLDALFRKKRNKYANFHSIHLLDREATADKIRNIKDTLAKTRPADKVVLYIASHGLIDNDLNYYLATHATDPLDPAKGGLTYSALENLLDSIPARNKLILLDACHSGEYDAENVGKVEKIKMEDDTLVFRNKGQTGIKPKIGYENSFQLMKRLFADLRRGVGATVIASASGTEAAMEGNRWRNSVFVYYIKMCLNVFDSDLNQDGGVSVFELQQQLAFWVPRVTNNRQRPTSRIKNSLNDFIIW